MVGQAAGVTLMLSPFSGGHLVVEGNSHYSPSTRWPEGGPLVERFRVGLGFFADSWVATCSESNEGCGATEDGETQLIAAMRAIVAECLGDSVSVPVELLGGQSHE